MQTDDCGVYVKLVARSAGVPSFYLLWDLDLINGVEEVVPPKEKEGLRIEHGSSPNQTGPAPFRQTKGKILY